MESKVDQLIKVDPKDTVFARKPVLNVWGFKSPLLAASTFKPTVRIKTYDGASIEGVSVKIVDPKTGKVLGSSRVGTKDDTAAGILQDEIELAVPAEPGLHKYTALIESGSEGIPIQVSVPFSVVPMGSRTVKVTCADDKSGKPVAARLFFYNTELEKTKPIDFRANAQGVAEAVLVPGVRYKVHAVCEDYVSAFLEIPAEPEQDSFELPMRYIFNVKIKRPY